MISVFIREEYGYRYWRWDYSGTHEELIADWKAGLAPLNFFDPSVGEYKGTMTQLDAAADAEYDEAGKEYHRSASVDEFDKGRRQQQAQGGPVYQAHVHEPDATFLEVRYRSPYWKPEVEVKS